MPYDRNVLTIICRCICYLFIFAFFINSVLYLLRGGTEIANTISSAPAMQVLLIPLDSRPSCKDYPGQLARIANINVLVPPPGYLDYYKQPANTEALAQWLMVVGPSADAVIVSVDQLVHGGLLASRLPAGDRNNAQKVLLLLERFHMQNPHIPIYAFNIIPRLLLAETEENKPYQQDMAAYSILTDKLSLSINTGERLQLEQLESIIPASIRHRYEDMYATNLWLGQQLMSMAAKGILHYVVLGQDDAQPYGMANITKRSLQAWLSEHPCTDITIMRGTDEIAAMLIARLITDNSHFYPHVYVRYSWPGAPQVIMPYMPDTVEQTIGEKIAMVKGVQVQNPEDADFILYVHIGTPQTPPGVMKLAADEIKQYLKAGRAVSLVDLSQDYSRQKYLFPFLETAKISISDLTSYNGWNTASNSIGTAVAHAVIYAYSRHNQVLVPEKHYAYLFQHVLDDWYYQKLVQPKLNSLLTRKGIKPVSLGEHYTAADEMAQKELTFYAGHLYTHHFQDTSGAKDGIRKPRFQIQLPWPRTFEIQLDVFFDHISNKT